MDDDVADLVSTEVRNFFTSIVTPFLDTLNECDRQHAKSWSQRVLNMKNYPLMKNYLILLTYMIASGRLVSPFDVDSSRCRLPRIPAEFREKALFDYVQGEIEMVKRKDLVEATESALSRDEMAFLAQLPAPTGGIRLYLATSDRPYSEWSRADKYPLPTKYDVSAKDFVSEGLELVNQKFNQAEDASHREMKSHAEGSSPSGRPARVDDNNDGTEFQSRYSTSAIDESSRNDNTDGNVSSAYEYDSLLKSPVTKEPRVQIVGRRKPEFHKCVIEVPPAGQAVIEEISDIAIDDLPDLPPSLITEEDFHREENIRARANRWFGDPVYNRYKETIKKLLRRKIPVDTIRRNIHRCMRQRLHPAVNIPNWLRDSLDESEPFHLRLAHLKMRFSDVLKNEYGVHDQGELFHLTNTPGLSEHDEHKARELIRRAEEGTVDPAIRRLFAENTNRSCATLMGLLDEILARDLDAPHTSSRAPKTEANATANASLATPATLATPAERRPWPYVGSTSRSASRGADRSPSARDTTSAASASAAKSTHEGQRRVDKRESYRRPPGVCCPPEFPSESTRSRNDADNGGCAGGRRTNDADRTAADRAFDSNDGGSWLSDYKIENERADDLFDKLPPDSISDSSTNEESRRNKSSGKRNSK